VVDVLSDNADATSSAELPLFAAYPKLLKTLYRLPLCQLPLA
jgi:hypothetical protein